MTAAAELFLPAEEKRSPAWKDREDVREGGRKKEAKNAIMQDSTIVSLMWRDGGAAHLRDIQAPPIVLVEHGGISRMR